MNKNLLKGLLAGAILAVCFLPALSGRTAVHAASGTSIMTNTGMSEEARLARLETLLDKLFSLLEQLYPQVNWEKARGNDSSMGNNQDEDDDDDNDGADDDDDNDSTKGDDDDISTDVRSTNATAPVGGDEARANFEIPITLSAFSGDFYIPKSALRSASASASAGVTYKIEDGSGTTYAGGSTSASFTSSSRSGDTNDYYKVNEGDKRAFMLNVTLDNAGATQGFYRAQLVGVTFDDNTSAGGEDVLSTGFNKYETPVVFVDDTDDPN